MSPSPDYSDIDRFFGTLKNMNDLDKAEIRNVVSGLINPTPRDRCVTLNYERAAINIELLLTLGNTQQFQVISIDHAFVIRGSR